MTKKERINEWMMNKIIRFVIRYLKRNPERNIKTAMNLLYQTSRFLPITKIQKTQIRQIKHLVDEKRPGAQLIINLFRDTSLDTLLKLGTNFIVNAVGLGIPRQRALTKELGINIPWFYLIDPTEKCNYHCKGCWAGAYGKIEMEPELFDRIMKEGKEMGIYYVVISGGEPTIWPHLIEMVKKHKDIAFMMFTNGSMIASKKYAKRVAEAGNIIPCFSVEGFKEKTDERRGKGAWERVMKAMDNMKELGVPFGYSITQTHQNIQEVMSDEFVDFMVREGAKIAWYFQYIPIGDTPDLSMMLTPEERLYSYHRIHKIRATKPLFAADFWNDGPYTGGCLAGGRRYLHITADGGIEPCAFIHLSQGNIKDMSLLDTLQLPFFKEIQKLQPYSDNLLNVCLLVDHPDYFRKIASLPGVRNTDGTVRNMSKEVGKHLDELSKKWEKLSRPVFEKDFPEIARKTREYKKKKEEMLKQQKDVEQFSISESDSELKNKK